MSDDYPLPKGYWKKFDEVVKKIDDRRTLNKLDYEYKKSTPEDIHNSKLSYILREHRWLYDMQDPLINSLIMYFCNTEEMSIYELFKKIIEAQRSEKSNFYGTGPTYGGEQF